MLYLIEKYSQGQTSWVVFLFCNIPYGLRALKSLQLTQYVALSPIAITCINRQTASKIRNKQFR